MKRFRALQLEVEDNSTARRSKKMKRFRALEVEDNSTANRSKKMELDWKKQKPENHDNKEEEFSVILPDEIVGSILSMMPYPSILKAKELSREWYGKLSNTGDVEDAGFCGMVNSNSKSKWPIFFPCAWNFVKDSISFARFDRLTGTWFKTVLPLPCPVVTKILTSTGFCSPDRQAGEFTGIDGLICSPVNSCKTEIFVLNVFTREWKWLPPLPNVHGGGDTFSVIPTIHMFRDGFKHYKVVTMRKLVNNGHRDKICTQVYESKSDSWITKLTDFEASPFWYKGVYLNGSLYFIWPHCFEVWAYNIDNSTWRKLRTARSSVSIGHMTRHLGHDAYCLNLIVSNDRLMVMLRLESRRHEIRENSLCLCEINTLTEMVSEVYKGPPEPISGASINCYSSDGDSIFFTHDLENTQYIMEFSTSRQVWISHLHPSSSADRPVSFLASSYVLQPGKNPFRKA